MEPDGLTQDERIFKALQEIHTIAADIDLSAAHQRKVLETVAQKALDALRDAASSSVDAGYREALVSAEWDLANCDWSCERCGHDYGMKDTDVYATVKRALYAAPKDAQAAAAQDTVREQLLDIARCMQREHDDARAPWLHSSDIELIRDVAGRYPLLAQPAAREDWCERERLSLRALRDILTGFEVQVVRQPLQEPATYLEEVRLSCEYQPGVGERVAASLRNILAAPPAQPDAQEKK